MNKALVTIKSVLATGEPREYHFLGMTIIHRPFKRWWVGVVSLMVGSGAMLGLYMLMVGDY